MSTNKVKTGSKVFFSMSFEVPVDMMFDGAIGENYITKNKVYEITKVAPIGRKDKKERTYQDNAKKLYFLVCDLGMLIHITDNSKMAKCMEVL